VRLNMVLRYAIAFVCGRARTFPLTAFAEVDADLLDNNAV
jgi:hypothetical protein